MYTSLSKKQTAISPKALTFYPKNGSINTVMWELRTILPHGRIHLRNLVLIVTSLLVAVFSCNLLLSAPVSAADAVRNGNTITYNNGSFTQTADIQAGDSRQLPVGTHVFEFQNPQTNKREAIIIDAAQDPTKATSAQYIVYDFNSGQYSNPSPPVGVTIVNGITNNTSSPTPSTCSGSVTNGLGWFICPIVNFLASGMDHLYSALSSFLTVRPVQTSTTNSLYRMWAIVRDIANALFVVAFLVVIYSQISNVGISNYGIKKMLPRLIITAVLVNISYWICALAVDVSNYLGYAIHDMFLGIFNAMSTTENYGNITALSWSSVASAVLSGGTAVTALGLYAKFVVLGGSLPGALYLLIPILVGILMAVLVALLVMAARQALITVLIIVSPLAFVAYILPNTEKYFTKWRELLTTMLLMFPIFAVIFGGSQLAGMAIIQNADSFNLIILGMAVQIAPVAITPMLIKFSGSLLGRIAGMVNNPKAGIMDRTRNWAKERAEQEKARVLAGKGRNNWANRTTRNVNYNRRRREAWKKVNESTYDNLFNDSMEGRRIDTATRQTERDKQRIQHSLDENWHVKIKTDASELEKELSVRLAGDRAKLAGEQIEAAYDELRVGHAPIATPAMQQLAATAFETAEGISLTAIRKSQAEHRLKNQINDELLSNGQVHQRDEHGVIRRDADGKPIFSGQVRAIDGRSLNEYATGIGHKDNVLAGAISEGRSEWGKQAAAAGELMKHFKLESGQYQSLAAKGKGTVIRAVDDSGNVHEFDAGDEYVKEAAIVTQFKEGSYAQKMAILNETGSKVVDTNPDGSVKLDSSGNVVYRKGVNYAHRLSVKSEAIGSGIQRLAPFINDVTFNEIVKGNFNGIDSTNMHAMRQIFEGRIKTDNLAGANFEALDILYKLGSLKRSADPADQAEFARHRSAMFELFEGMYGGTSDPRYQKVISTFDDKFDKNFAGMLNGTRDILTSPTVGRDTPESSREVMAKALRDAGIVI